ncbi:MAG: DUF3857 and transglutaminase domain-containing protein [Candidatus Poribacteria bacterium]|nr:DUF3857 and transglutaminase domain-containing protein [Candidatus Poribacteria bacterium]
MRRIIITILAVFLSVSTTTFATDYVLILGGVGGEKSYYDQFWSATSRFHQLLTQEYGLDSEQITFLFEDEGNLPGLVTGEAKREPILEAFAQLAEKVQPTDRFILFMVGHASRTSSGVKFNLPGRDISQQEYTDSINNIRAEQQLLVFGFPYSARIVQGISKSGRIIITSSSSREGYASQAGFGDIFVDVFSEPYADTNDDGAISLLEAFLWVQTRVDEWYTEDGAIQAEHPHLDDNGDGRASRKDLEANGEGALADKTFLGTRRTSLPPKEQSTIENPQEAQNESSTPHAKENGHNHREDPPDKKEQGEMKGKSSLPYNFISEADEQAIQENIKNVPAEPNNPEEGAIVLWEAEVYDVDEDSRHVYSTRRVVKIFNEDGYHFGEIKIPYTQNADDVTIHHARTFKPDGTQVKLDERKIIRGLTPASYAEAGLLVDTRLMYFELPDISDGCIIDYAYSTRNPRGAMKGEFWRQVYFQVDVPVQSYRLTAHIPKKTPLFYQVDGPPIEPTITENNYTRAYTFETKDVPALHREPLMPAVSDFAYNISLSSIDSWDKLITWYATLIREQDRITKEIEAKTKEILTGALSRQEKIKRLYEFVATNIQYAGDERGIWGIKPIAAGKVLEGEWGDCKGKSTLLSTMLRVAGIDSYPVLISAGKPSGIVPEVPSLAYFNHMILAVDGGKGKDLIWLDPTAQTCAFGDFPASDQNRWALIVNTDAPTTDGIDVGTVDTLVQDQKKLDGKKVKSLLYAFQKSPALPADSNVRHTKTHVIIKKDLSVEVTHELRVSGDFNARLRAHLLGADHREERIRFLRSALELDERAKVEHFEISDVKQLGPELKINLTWSCDEYLYKMGDQFILELPVVQHPYAELLREDERDHPAVLGKALTFEDQISVEVEVPFTVEMVPDPQKLKTDVAEIHIDYTKSGQKAGMKQTIRFHAPKVEAAQISNLTNVVRIASSQSTKRFILIQKP